MTIQESNLAKSGKRRLLKELEMVNQEKGLGISAALCKTPTGQETLDEWDVYIIGPQESPYEGYQLHARMTFPSQYPYHPPTFKFLSPVFHPNVYTDGKICISILQTDQDEIIDADAQNNTWTPGLNVRTVCLSIISLLNAPNIYSPANVDASNLYRDDKEGFNKKVKADLDKRCKKIEK